VRVSYDYQGPVPVAGENTRVVTVDVPQGHEKLDFATICTRFRVDPQTSELVEHKA
jgi:hypothetical protein